MSDPTIGNSNFANDIKEFQKKTAQNDTSVTKYGGVGCGGDSGSAFDTDIKEFEKNDTSVTKYGGVGCGGAFDTNIKELEKRGSSEILDAINNVSIEENLESKIIDTIEE